MNLKHTVISLSLFSLLASSPSFAQTEIYPIHKKHPHHVNKQAHVIKRNKYVCRHPHYVYRLPHHVTHHVTHVTHHVCKPVPRIKPAVHVYRPKTIRPVPPRVIYKDVYIPAVIPCRTILMDGFYIGTAGGYDTYNVRQNFNYSDGFISNNQNPVFRTNGFLGELFLGYGRSFQTFYLGAEIFGNLNSANGGYRSNISNSVFYNNKTQVRGSYGASVLPGIKPTDTSLVYVRLGYTETKLNIKETMTDLNTHTDSSVSRGRWKGGFTSGGGIEAALAPHISARLEYTHTNYDTFSNYPLGNNVMGTANRYTFADNQVMLGLIYHA